MEHRIYDFGFRDIMDFMQATVVLSLLYPALHPAAAQSSMVRSFNAWELLFMKLSESTSC
ncbi:hypothetical protein [Rhodopila sp.]|uniref:hypothetical protein n=1 Tax=Rhodopila sp. TaxID=2480087 RepID=UPI003D0FDCC1